MCIRDREVDVEGHAVGGEVGVLFAAQVGHGELPDRVEVVRVLRAMHDVVFEFDRVAAQVAVRDVDDVIAAVAVLRPRRIVGRLAERACSTPTAGP